MSSFDLLHPALQHHIVNSLGWNELRPFQNEVIPRILDGENLIVLAPTAGGKTEASLFPTLSNMLTENWSAMSVLYICPIKALLNNLDDRLRYYCDLLGRRSALWHGDVAPTARKRILREPPDCLLTTPESLEVMLDSPSVDSRRFFSNLKMVVVDEIHAFAGDDRGWHLLSVLERISRIAGTDIQRVGLSATVGNPKILADWLAGSSQRKRGVYFPAKQDGAKGAANDADVQLDYVGSLDNAAVVISRLHRGEKRLVFVDSRARAEQLATALRTLEVTTFVTHSSLSQSQRKQAEEAFATRSDCVIVATSVLELGIDVGSLERVIQIDSPSTIASFLQRMGRTGRRSGTVRNCLFLATKDETLLQAAGLIELWKSGFVEPIVPPAQPYHVLAQQIMALCLQQSGIGESQIEVWLKGFIDYAQLDRLPDVVKSMLDREILWQDVGILALGQEGESAYGRRNFLELFSVFMSPPQFTVLHGRQEIGYVDQLTFLGKTDGPRILLLAGRAWRVNHIDWARRRAFVEVTEAKGRTRWMGDSQAFSYELCQAIKSVLVSDGEKSEWSDRTIASVQEIRQEYAWLRNDSTACLPGRTGEFEWWTFGGRRANATLGHTLAAKLDAPTIATNFMIRFDSSVQLDALSEAIETTSQQDAVLMRPNVDERAMEGIKFVDCLEEAIAIQMLEKRLSDPGTVRALLDQNIRFVSL